MVPEGWKIKALSDIAAVERGKFSVRPRNDPQYYGGAIPFIQTGDVATSGGRITSYSQTLNERGLAVSRLFPKGTIFITIAANIGNAAIAEFDTACPDSIVAVQPTDDTSVMWLLHVLMLEQPKLDAYASQNAQKNINLETLRPLPILTPPNEEQHRIAAILSTWNTAITQTEKLIEANRKLKKGLMQQLLTGKRRFSGFKDKWQMLSVKDLCTYIGSGGTPSTSVPEYWSGTIPWITGADFTERGIGVVRRYITDEAVQSSATRVCPQGSILLVSRTGVGKIALAPFNVAISQDITVLELTPNFTDPQFILFALAMSLSRLQRFNQGTSINGVMRKDLICHQIFVPSLQEQKKISTVLRAMDSEIDSLTSYVEQLQEQKHGLMQKLLTGQIRVKATYEVLCSMETWGQSPGW